MALYGGPQGGNCYGTMGWTGTDPRIYMMTAFFRPEEMAARTATYDPSAASARELRLLTWAVAGPTNWRAYERLKSSRAKFLAEMTEYYTQALHFSRDQAATLAERAYGFLIEETDYGRNNDWDGITYFAINRDNPITIGPGTTPDEIARALFPRALVLPERDRDSNLLNDLWRQALLLAICTDQPDPLVSDLLERFTTQEQRREYGVAYGYPDTGAIPPLGTAIAAAISSPRMMTLLLNHGVDPDTPTTYFQKTALMYAAQDNNLAAARLLVEHGANPNLATDSKGWSCGGSLNRDHRTALMYAAENASAVLIDLLLAAGADPKSQDSQGNLVRWYLYKNTTLNEAERRALDKRLRAD